MKQVVPVFQNQVIKTQQQSVLIIKCVFRVIHGVHNNVNVFLYRMSPWYAIKHRFVMQIKLSIQHLVNAKTKSKIQRFVPLKTVQVHKFLTT